MDAHAVPLLGLFEKKMRLEVPLFQRQYVWNKEQQWEPLWDDISRKFTEWIEGRKDAPVHFLGAMVLDQKQTPVTHVEKRQVIDGQQRLTTLQIFLAAMRDFCKHQHFEDLANEFEGYTLNRGMMAEREVDQFKVWPTQADRNQFIDVLTLRSRAAIEAKHPLRARPRARKNKYEPRPRMIEAYLFFNECIRQFFLGDGSTPALCGHLSLQARVEESLQALRQALKIVAIDLDRDDDAQVIFETLNARGEPLLPADLLRNYIFLRASRNGESTEALYEQYWKKFDDPFWREEVTQGRLQRPRSDLFMQHFLSSRQTEDIPIKHLYVEYRFWIERKQPFSTISQELETLSRQGEDFRRIIQPKQSDLVFALASFMDKFDIRTAYPLLLFLLDSKISNAEWSEISKLLESYLLRRAVLGWSTKAYNRIFLNITKHLRKDGPSANAVKKILSDLSGESSAWPNDDKFSEAWLMGNAYSTLNNAKITHVLLRINETYRTSKNEEISINSPLTVEHLLPQNWLEHWPLQNGERGLEYWASFQEQSNDERAKNSVVRYAMLNTFGNLTILTQPLNSAASNSAWATKKGEVLKSSLLPINQILHDFNSWDEGAIARRGKNLLAKALAIWPGPIAGAGSK